jgi:multiple sugar transport system ATP-binding protein
MVLSAAKRGRSSCRKLRPCYLTLKAGGVCKTRVCNLAKLELISVSKRFGRATAVDDVSLVVEDNELFCLFGPPGCGKSTILRLLLGLDAPDSGRIRIGGRDVTQLPPAERDLAMVFQNLALFPHMSARDNLAFPLISRRADPKHISAKVAQVAETLHIDHLLDKFPAHLSGGERQRVAIGRALVRNPKAYLMDEPISALDARLREEMRVELNRLQRQLNHTFVHVTHDQEEAMAVADRLCVMREGRVEQIGTSLELYNAPQNRYVARQLGSPPINFISGKFDASGGVFEATEMPLAALASKGNVGRRAAWLGVRPEDLTIVRNKSAGEVSVPASIYEVEPLGAITIVDVKVGEQILKAQLPGQPKFLEGESVNLCFDLGKCHLFDSDTERRLATGLVAVNRN